MDLLDKLNLPVPEWCFLSQALQWAAEKKPILMPGYYVAMEGPSIEELDGEGYTEAKRALRIALAEGKLVAEAPRHQANKNDEWTEDDVVIPPDVWLGPGIKWERDEVIDVVPNELDYEIISYEMVLMPTRQLFELFGEPEDSRRQAEYLMRKGRARRGRPSEYSWERFYVEIAVLAHRSRDGLPETKKELREVMQSWCETHWGKAPKETMLSEKISALYDHPDLSRPLKQVSDLLRDQA